MTSLPFPWDLVGDHCHRYNIVEDTSFDKDMVELMGHAQVFCERHCKEYSNSSDVDVLGLIAKGYYSGKK